MHSEKNGVVVGHVWPFFHGLESSAWGSALAGFLAFRSITPGLASAAGGFPPNPSPAAPCVQQARLSGERRVRWQKARVLPLRWSPERAGWVPGLTQGWRSHWGFKSSLKPILSIYFTICILLSQRCLLMTFNESRCILNCKYKKSYRQVQL